MTESAPEPTPAPDAGTVRSALEAVAALLAPGIPGVAEQVLHAHDDPAGFVRAHADRLDDRGIDEPFPGLPWIALVNALDDQGLLAEFDWKEGSDEIHWQLGRLESRPSVDPLALLGTAGTELPTHEFLELCGRHYGEVGKALAVLDIESDCYPVVCLPARLAGELTAVAARAGFAAWHLGGGTA
ncbi:DUF6630 family protein [Actinacidiphila alni]|uniref:DUF6630 family protein n=1 Tax=Actinacidiphila alni TaxID=380248 RepID=UPI003454B6E7